ncbi:hypothetical protein Y032_0561g3483 [Ancylostoma ceylanicum]|nr:hypothetical protein Y032_0561g3483 [Ancylostoma ceylanicum]
MKVLLRDQYLETEKRTSLHKTTTTETKDCGSGSRSSKYVKNSLLSMVLPLPHHHSSYGIRQSINNVDAFHSTSSIDCKSLMIFVSFHTACVNCNKYSCSQ